MNAQSREEVRRLIKLLSDIKLHEEREFGGPIEDLQEDGVEYVGYYYDCGCEYNNECVVIVRCSGNIKGIADDRGGVA